MALQSGKGAFNHASLPSRRLSSWKGFIAGLVNERLWITLFPRSIDRCPEGFYRDRFSVIRSRPGIDARLVRCFRGCELSSGLLICELLFVRCEQENTFSKKS